MEGRHQEHGFVSVGPSWRRSRCRLLALVRISGFDQSLEDLVRGGGRTTGKGSGCLPGGPSRRHCRDLSGLSVELPSRRVRAQCKGPSQVFGVGERGAGEAAQTAAGSRCIPSGAGGGHPRGVPPLPWCLRGKRVCVPRPSASATDAIGEIRAPTRAERRARQAGYGPGRGRGGRPRRCNRSGPLRRRDLRPTGANRAKQRGDGPKLPADGGNGPRNRSGAYPRHPSPVPPRDCTGTWRSPS